MARDTANSVRIIELSKSDRDLPRLKYRYATTRYYDTSIAPGPDGWKIELRLRPLKRAVEKVHASALFKEHVPEPRAFAAAIGARRVGWIELGHERWNNRMRVWEFLVKEKYRGMGIGNLLMDRAILFARRKRARMLVLETQSCNVPAIAFYLHRGFNLIGLDSAAYSNQDIHKREVRLELGLAL